MTPRSALTDPDAISFSLTVDGALRQEGTTADLTHGVPALLTHLARLTPLGPGDLVFTGTPAEATLATVTEATRFELGGYLNVARLRNWKVSYHLPEGKVSVVTSPASEDSGS